jgi:hypothetical protein
VTDTRLPSHWLLHPTFLQLSPEDWFVYTRALMWCNHQLTDGAIPANVLGLLHPEGAKPEIYERLTRFALWSKTEYGYLSLEWEEHQTPRSEFLRQRELSRARKRAERERARLKLEPSKPVLAIESVTGPVTRDPLGKAKAKAQEQAKEKAKVKEQAKGLGLTASGDQAIDDWPVAAIPGKDYEDGDTF